MAPEESRPQRLPVANADIPAGESPPRATLMAPACPWASMPGKDPQRRHIQRRARWLRCSESDDVFDTVVDVDEAFVPPFPFPLADDRFWPPPISSHENVSIDAAMGRANPMTPSAIILSAAFASPPDSSALLTKGEKSGAPNARKLTMIPVANPCHPSKRLSALDILMLRAYLKSLQAGVIVILDQLYVNDNNTRCFDVN